MPQVDHAVNGRSKNKKTYKKAIEPHQINYHRKHIKGTEKKHISVGDKQ